MTASVEVACCVCRKSQKLHNFTNNLTLQQEASGLFPCCVFVQVMLLGMSQICATESGAEGSFDSNGGSL